MVYYTMFHCFTLIAFLKYKEPMSGTKFMNMLIHNAGCEVICMFVFKAFGDAGR